MQTIVASLIFAIGILGLFYLDRGAEARPSKALWIPTIWLFLASSRPLSLWLGMAPSASTQAYSEGSPIDRTLDLILLFFTLAVILTRLKRVGPLLRRNIPLLLYIFYCAASISWSDFPFVALKRWVRLVELVLVVLIIMTESEQMAALKSLITRLGFVLFPLSVLFIKYYPSLGRMMTNSWLNEFTGVTTQKNSLGAICMVYGAGFLWAFTITYRRRASPARRRRLYAYGTILLMIVWLLKMCNSMTSIVGLAMAGTVMLFSTRSSLVRKRPLVHALVLGIVGMSLFTMFYLPKILEAFGKNPNLSGRYSIWELVLSMHTNPWIGTGYESFWLGRRLQEIWQAMPNMPISEAHNGWTEVYINLGWVGVGLIALLVLTTYRKAIGVFRQHPEEGALFVCFLLVTIFESLTEAAFRCPSPTWTFLVVALLSASAGVHWVGEAGGHVRSLGDSGEDAQEPVETWVS